jgi:type VI protein secretion system component VasF
VAAVVLAGAAFPRQQPQASPGSGESNSAPQAASVPAVPAQPETPEEKAAQHGGDEGSLQSSQQIAEESAKLLRLATDLKAEVDKTNKDTLSLHVVRKADEIERLAHNVRIRMRAVVAAN